MKRKLMSLFASALMVLGVMAISIPVASAAPVCGGGRYVTLYEHENYGGDKITICASGGSAATLGSWNDKASSAIVGGSSSTRVCFYTDAYFLFLNWSSIGPDRPVYTPNDSLSSIKFINSATCN